MQVEKCLQRCVNKMQNFLISFLQGGFIAHLFIFKVNFWPIHQWRFKTAVAHEYGADPFFKERLTGKLLFCNDFIRGEQSFCKNFVLHWPCIIINFALSLRIVAQKGHILHLAQEFLS